MPELRTTDCREVGHPELVIWFSDPEDEPHVRRWSESVIERVWGGEILRDGQHDSYFGWRVKFVVEDDHVTVHEDDMTRDIDAIRFVSGIDLAARWIHAQRDVAESYGLAFTPIDARLSTFAVCPEAHDKPYLLGALARSKSVDVASGWYLGCHDEDCRGRGPSGRWHMLALRELLELRSDVVPYLALPPGVAVTLSPIRDPEVGKHDADVRLDPAWNPLRISKREDPAQPLLRGYAYLGEVRNIALPEGSRWHARVHRVHDLVLDPSTDPELGRGFYPLAEIMKRHRVNLPTAERALRAALVPSQFERWLVAHHRDAFPTGIYERVRAELDAPAVERWKLQDTIARALVTETKIPFSELKKPIDALDRELQRFIQRAAKLEAQPSPLRDLD